MDESTETDDLTPEELSRLRLLLRDQGIDEFIEIADFPPDEVNRIKHLLRHHADAMVEAGVALKYGRGWRINRSKLPGFLRELTLRLLRSQATAADNKQRRRKCRRKSAASTGKSCLGK
jgi:hypothetical protein